MSIKREHIYEIHYIRAIASLMVLLVHVSATYFYEHGQQFNDYTFFINQISRFGTPMFAMISGILLFYQTRKRGFNLRKFLSSRFTKIGIPFFAWSTFYLLFLYFTENISPFENGTNAFLLNFLTGNSYYHLYFIAIVFQFYLIYPLLQIFRSKVSWTILLILAALVNIYFIKLSIPEDGIWSTILSQRSFLPEWIFFFIFGGYLAYHWEPITTFSKKYKIAFIAAAVIVTVLAVMEYKKVGSIPSNRVTNFINIPILTLFIIGIKDDIMKINLFDQFLKKIGTLSMAIYLVHPFIINVFQRIAPSFLWKTSLFPVTFVIILFASIVMIKLIQLLPFGQIILTVPKNADTKNPGRANQALQKPSFVQAARKGL